MTELLKEPVLEIVSHLKTGVHYLDELVERYMCSGVPTVPGLSLLFVPLLISNYVGRTSKGLARWIFSITGGV